MKNKSNKINISFLNLAAQSPSIELNLALSEKIHRQSNDLEHIFFMCDRALTSCSVNITNSKSVCDICRHKARVGFKYFNERNPNSKLIKVKREELKLSSVNDNVFNEIILNIEEG